MHEKILKNAAECRVCHDVIESKSVHDFRYCKCGEIFVDGGKEYLRRGGKSLSNVIEKSEIEMQPASFYLTERVVALKKFDKERIRAVLNDALEWSILLDIMRAIRYNEKLRPLPYDQIEEIEKILKKELVGK